MAMPPKENITYILQCSDNTLYTGWTNNIKKTPAGPQPWTSKQIYPQPQARHPGVRGTPRHQARGHAAGSRDQTAVPQAEGSLNQEQPGADVPSSVSKKWASWPQRNTS